MRTVLIFKLRTVLIFIILGSVCQEMPLTDRAKYHAPEYLRYDRRLIHYDVVIRTKGIQHDTYKAANKTADQYLDSQTGFQVMSLNRY